MSPRFTFPDDEPDKDDENVAERDEFIFIDMGRFGGLPDFDDPLATAEWIDNLPLRHDKKVEILKRMGHKWND